MNIKSKRLYAAAFLFSLVLAVCEAAPSSNALNGRWKDPKHGFSLDCPSGWTLMSPSEVRRKTAGAMYISPNAMVFCVNDKDPDSNINVQYVGDASREAPTNDSARRFLASIKYSLVSNLQKQLPGFTKVSSKMRDLSGGVAWELVYTTNRGSEPMQQKQLMLIAKSKAFTITCTAKKSKFKQADKNGFTFMVSSIVVN